ncbi:unnamed protein product [Adineta ricciae]|uniref:Uncharacterized protein n=1 Tax=Adineta ricciae TaxID=249248 RepID=A0A815T496_ADIRI|nr:unnamed protein product [Adineta ricciae]CAF1498113.1 unnamed protein product [Adineta ricciae]
MATFPNQWNPQYVPSMTIQLPPLIVRLPIQLIPIATPPISSYAPPSQAPTTPMPPQPSSQAPTIPVPPQPTSFPTPPVSPHQKASEHIVLCMNCGRTRVVINVNGKRSHTDHVCSDHAQVSNDLKAGTKKIKKEEI